MNKSIIYIHMEHLFSQRLCVALIWIEIKQLYCDRKGNLMYSMNRWLILIFILICNFSNVSFMFYFYLLINMLQVKKRQQRVMMILDSKNVEYEIIDITEPGKELDKEFMQTNSNARTNKYPLPPQIFNEDDYCGVTVFFSSYYLVLCFVALLCWF